MIFIGFECYGFSIADIEGTQLLYNKRAKLNDVKYINEHDSMPMIKVVGNYYNLKVVVYVMFIKKLKILL